MTSFINQAMEQYGKRHEGETQMQAHAAARAQLLVALDQAIRDVGVECVAAALLERARVPLRPSACAPVQTD